MAISVDSVSTLAALGESTKQLLIDGKWVPAKSGKTFPSINPSTGEVIAQVAEGGAEDVDLAVGAARRAFEGAWRDLKPRDRQNLMLKLADLIDEHQDELRFLDVVDMGSPIGGGRSRARGSSGSGPSRPGARCRPRPAPRSSSPRVPWCRPCTSSA